MKTNSSVGWTIELESKFKHDKINLHRKNEQYLREHPELKQLLHHVTTQVLMHKPPNVFQFITGIFQEGSKANDAKVIEKPVVSQRDSVDLAEYVKESLNGTFGSIFSLNELAAAKSISLTNVEIEQPEISIAGAVEVPKQISIQNLTGQESSEAEGQGETSEEVTDEEADVQVEAEDNDGVNNVTTELSQEYLGEAIEDGENSDAKEEVLNDEAEPSLETEENLENADNILETIENSEETENILHGDEEEALDEISEDTP